MKSRVSHIPLSDIDTLSNEKGIHLCIWCKKELEGRKTRWCGWNCTEQVLIRQSHPYLRKYMISQVDSKCIQCGKQKLNQDLILDHIKPIALGGGEFDQDNVQVLCKACNKIKTAQDAKCITQARRIERKLTNGQVQLKEVSQ